MSTCYSNLMSIKLIIIFSTLIFVHTEFIQSQDISYSYQEIFRIGDSEEFDENYSFTSPYHIAVGEGGWIYVSDRRLNEIRIFDAEGSFMNKIGERGRGPGEFNEISSMYIDPSQNHLIVVDRMNLRANRFDMNGKHLDTHLLPEGPVISPWLGRADVEGNHYLLYRTPVMPNQPRPEEDYLIHIYEPNFTKKTSSAVNAKLYGELDNYFVDSMIGGPTTGLFEPLKNGQQLIAAPFIYAGEIYLFENTGDSWQKMYTLKGVELVGDSFREIDADNTPDYAIRMGTPRGTLAGLIFSSSIGIHHVNESIIAHYIHFQDEDHNRGEIGVSLFDITTGKHLGYSKIEELSRDYQSIRTGWLIQVKYARDNKIYFVDNRYGEPHVVVAEIMFELD